eukprot:7997490-Karenia_brevis.AAC.1
MIVNLQALSRHVGVRCAERCFFVQNLTRHSGNIDTRSIEKKDNETQAAMDVFIQSAPTRSVRRVLAATT